MYLESEKFIDISSVTVTSMYNHKNYEVEWRQNGTILVLGAVELSPNKPVHNPIENNKENPSILNLVRNRKRKSIDSILKPYYNPLLQKIVEKNEETSESWSDMGLMNNQFEEDMFAFDNHVLDNLPSNRTIRFNCADDPTFCLQGKFMVQNFRANDSPLVITLNFTVDIKKMANKMDEKKDIFVIHTSIEVIKSSDEDT